MWSLAVNRMQGISAFNPHKYEAYEKFVLESMTVDEASLRLRRLDSGIAAKSMGSIVTDCGTQDDGFKEMRQRQLSSPVALLAKQAIRDYVRRHAEDAFIQAVSGGQIDHANYSRDMNRIVAAGNSLDAPLVALMVIFNQVCDGKGQAMSITHINTDFVKESLGFPEVIVDVDTKVDAELKALLYGIALYRHIITEKSIASHKSGIICPSSDVVASLTSPASSSFFESEKTAKTLQNILQLCLSSSAYDRTEGLKSARSRAIDLLNG